MECRGRAERDRNKGRRISRPMPSRGHPGIRSPGPRGRQRLFSPTRLAAPRVPDAEIALLGCLIRRIMRIDAQFVKRFAQYLQSRCYNFSIDESSTRARLMSRPGLGHPSHRYSRPGDRQRVWGPDARMCVRTASPTPKMRDEAWSAAPTRPRHSIPKRAWSVWGRGAYRAPPRIPRSNSSLCY